MENQAKNTMRLRFLGAIGTVTGSCTLLEYYSCKNNQKQYFLIDAGSFQNENSEKQEAERQKVLKHFAKDIKKIFITHAHLDHIGMLPEIIRYGFAGEVYCTRATHDLLIPMLTHGEGNEQNLKLLDKISFYDIDGRHGENPNNGFGRIYIPITHDFNFGILGSSHVLGSCTFYFRWAEKNYPSDFPKEEKEWKFLYFSGDIGPVSDSARQNMIFKRHQTPYWDKYDKCVVMESTYGGVVRDKNNLFHKKIERLSKILISKNETIVIPAFALDRAQQILVDLLYVFKNKETNSVLSTTENESWKNILKTQFGKLKLKNIVRIKHIKALEGNEELQKKIKNEIEKIVTIREYTSENIFTELNDACQNLVAKIFEQNNVPKPSVDKKAMIQSKLNFTFASPLIEKINKVYLKHLTDEFFSEKKEERKFQYLSDSFFEIFEIINTDLAEQKKAVNELLLFFLNKTDKSSKIIVTASGMCEEGTVVKYLEQCLTDEKATIILTGFQASSTNGFLLKNLANGKYDENNAKEKIQLKLKSRSLALADVKCKVEDMSEYYSGHADQEQLVDYITAPDPYKGKTGNITVLLNHGVNNAREALKTKIEERNPDIKVLLPEFNQWLNIVTLEYEPEDIEYKAEPNAQFVFIQAGDIHIYYPFDYDEEKIQSIIDYVNGL